jgi:hypothetical protein
MGPETSSDGSWVALLVFTGTTSVGFGDATMGFSGVDDAWQETKNPVTIIPSNKDRAFPNFICSPP